MKTPRLALVALLVSLAWAGSARALLDPGTEAIVEQALERLMTGRTTIVVAHRLSTVRRADRIAVVADGRLAEVGSHDELVALGGRYAALAAAWEASAV